MATLTLTSTKPSALKVDALIVAVAKKGDGFVLLPGAEDVDKAFNDVKGFTGGLAAAVKAMGNQGVVNEVSKLASLGATTAPVVVAVCVGKAVEPAKRGQAPVYGQEVLRRAVGTAVRSLAGTASVGLALPANTPADVVAVTEGALLAAYTFRRYRVTSAERVRPEVGSFSQVVPSPRDKATRAAVDRAQAVVQAVHLARDWVNIPPADLPPAVLADQAVAAAKAAGVTAEVLDEKALAKGGYGGIVGVGQGSSRPPRLVKLTYKGGRRGRKVPHLALVGKGITFDSGGLSLKPSASMETMKSDMGGAATVIGTITAIAKLGLPLDVTVWAPLAENMPSGTAQRPSDVLTIYGGTTVEVLNTDAEGRLVLADGLVRASEDKPDVLVDVATLTGAALVALGARTTGVMANDDTLRSAVVSAADAAGEQMWAMPLPVELRPGMESTVADIANIGDKYGGMLTAGLFLKEFVGEGIKWAHLDIAGPAYNDSAPHGYTPKGGTGHAIRTLVRLAENIADGTVATS